MSTPKQALEDLAKNKPWLAYFLYGEEAFKVQEFIEKLFDAWKEDGAAPTTERLDGASSTGNDILDVCKTMSLFGGFGSGGGKRLVLVRDTHQLKETDSLLEALVDGAKSQHPWPDTLLIFTAPTLDSRKKLHQWFKKAGAALEFKLARDAELVQWANYLAKKRGTSLEPQAADFLAAVCDQSLHRLDQEVEKAILFGIEEKDGKTKLPERISLDVVTKLASRATGAEMSDLVQAVFEKKRARALLLADRVVESNEDALGFVGYLTWALKNPEKFKGGPRTAPEGMEWASRLLELDQRLKSSPIEAKLLVDHYILRSD